MGSGAIDHGSKSCRRSWKLEKEKVKKEKQLKEYKKLQNRLDNHDSSRQTVHECNYSIKRENRPFKLQSRLESSRKERSQMNSGTLSADDKKS